MIAALSLAVPVYVIGWSHKYKEVLERFQMDEFMRDYKNVDASAMAGEISNALEPGARLTGADQEGFTRNADFLLNDNLMK